MHNNATLNAYPSRYQSNKEDHEAESKAKIYCARGRRNKTANKENANLEHSIWQNQSDYEQNLT